jgi:hypothetical protein
MYGFQPPSCNAIIYIGWLGFFLGDPKKMNKPILYPANLEATSAPEMAAVLVMQRLGIMLSSS